MFVFATSYFSPFMEKNTHNCLATNKILDWSKLKVSADNKLKFDFGRVENIAGREKNAGYQHFFFPLWF